MPDDGFRFRSSELQLFPIALLILTFATPILANCSSKLRNAFGQFTPAQAIGRDLTDADQRELEIAAVLHPLDQLGSRQGYGLSAPARAAVEKRAMDVAAQFLRSSGYAFRDTSASSSFDFEATFSGTLIKVEVKGTTSDRADGILMTANEVKLHRTEKGNTALIIVSSIRLSEKDGDHSSSGGMIEWLLGWDIDEWLHEPTAYRMTRPAMTKDLPTPQRAPSALG